MKFKTTILILFIFGANAQKSILFKGRVRNKITQSSLPFASVAVLDSDRKIVCGATIKTFCENRQVFTSQTDFSKVFENKSKLSFKGIYEYSGGPLRNQDNS